MPGKDSSAKNVVGEAADAEHAREVAETDATAENAKKDFGSPSFLSRTEGDAHQALKLLSILACGLSSIAIMLVVKFILTEYKFGCFLFVGGIQYLGTVVVLLVQRNITKTVPRFPLNNFFRTMFVTVFPLPILFLCNTISGLGASRDLSMPMFVLLRRFSIVMTMTLEWYMLRRRPKRMVTFAVSLMVIGALIATGFDVSFNLQGVAFVLINDLFTALQGVVLRKKMDEVSHIVTSEGILFYNNVFALCTTVVLIGANINGELDKLELFDNWDSSGFMFLLALSSVMGFVVNYCFFLCTKLNSPLTAAMVGAAKNVVTSYIGMLFSDYKYNAYSFAGLNVAVVGTVLYSREEWEKIKAKEQQRKENEEKEGLVAAANVVGDVVTDGKHPPKAEEK